MIERLSPKSLGVIVSLLLVVTAAVFYWRWAGSSRLKDRIYRIGWESDPPFQAAGPDGQPTGLAVELVREAARRRGVRLEWSHQTGGSEASLRAGRVDLWPLMTITPEREKLVHLTDPYLESEQCFLVRADSHYGQVSDLASAKISYYALPMNLRHIRNYLPNAQLISRATTKASIEAICRLEADAVFLEEFTALSALLEGPVCASQSLRMITIPDSRPRLAIGATFEARAAADAIRGEMGEMATEGRIAELMSSYSYFSKRNLESLEALLNARRRERLLIAVSLTFAFLFILTFWQAVRIRRERNRAMRAEGALRQADRNLRLMADNMKEMVLVYDMDRKLIFINRAVENLTGYAHADLQDGKFIDRIHPEDRVHMQYCWNQLFAGEPVRDQKYRLVTRDGKVLWLSANWGPVRDESGQQIGAQGSEQDITEKIIADELRTELEAQLRQAQKMEAFGQLAGGIAHDFNNLLTVINGYSDFLLAEVDDDESVKSMVKEIKDAGERAASLTRQLLTFSRRQVVQLRSLDLNEIVGNMTKMFQRLIGEDIALEAQFAPGGATLRADPGMIEQVLMNLAVNARDAMPKGGKLALRTAIVDQDAAPKTTHAKSRPGRFVRLTVSDTGCGIPPEILPHIFEPFFTTKDAGRGTGLGLATVFGIVEQHQGWIDVESQVGQGTTVHIYLPFSTPADTPPDNPVLVTPRGGTETLLLVEDEAPVRSLARRYLERCGYRIIEANSGPAALDIWQKHRHIIKLLLVDMVMPGGITGLELAGRMQEEEPDLKVIFATGYSEEALGREILTLPGTGLLRKPYSLSELGEKVRGTLDHVPS